MKQREKGVWTPILSELKLFIHAAKCHCSVSYRKTGMFLMLVFTVCFCSEGEEVALHDNVNDIFYTLKYEADLLFTRCDKCMISYFY